MKHQEIVQKVKWQDLVVLTAREVVIENSITLPWLTSSLVFAYFELYYLAVPCSILFFLTGLRQVHNGFHDSLGTGQFLTWFSLYLNSMLMMASIHAVKFNHLRHHKYCLQEEDYEGKSAKMKWYQAILYGPVHFFQIHRMTYVLGNSGYRLKMSLELSSIALLVLVAVYFQIDFLIYHIAFMVLGEFLSGFFAVWTVHHDIEEGEIARTQRNWWKNKLTFSMFYHLEHHLFPAVPTIKLKTLAKRMDDVLPELKKKSTF